MMMSNSIGEISKAWTACQAEMTLVKTNSENPHFNSKYADLGAILEVIRPVLGKHNLAFLQTTESNETCVVLTTTLLHSSGEWFATTLTMKPEKNTLQAFGSCLSYARRYSLSSLLGIAESDDDGNKASTQDFRFWLNNAQHVTRMQRNLDSIQCPQEYQATIMERLNGQDGRTWKEVAQKYAAEVMST